MITVKVNDQLVHLPQSSTLFEMLTQLDQISEGTALAVNQVIIPHEDWTRHRLTAGDDILLFQAIAGG